MHVIIKRLTKWLVRAISVFLPEAKAHELERWRRGREEFWKYNRCDYIFASYGKAGRTWVRVMISRYYQLVYKFPDNILMGFDNYTRLNRDIPKIFFTHDNYLRSNTEREMGRIVEFLGMEANEEYLRETAEFASVENLRKKEQENYFWRSGSRVQARDVNDPNTFKVRKAKVGGYRDYFDDDQAAELDAMVDSQLSPVFGYTRVKHRGKLMKSCLYTRTGECQVTVLAISLC